MAKKKIKFDATKARVATYDLEGNLLSEINGELKEDFYSGIEKMCRLSDDYCAFYKGKKMGIVDSRGEMIAPAEFESIKAEGDIFQISRKNKTTKESESGYINRQGDLLFDPSEYTPNCLNASDGRIVVESVDAGKEGAFDVEGNLVIEPKFLRLEGFYHNLSVACEEKGKVGLLGLDGNWALAPEYSEIAGFMRGIDELQDYSVAAKDGKYFLIDKDCNIVAGPVDQPITQYCDHDGMYLAVGDNDKIGVVAPNGEIVLPMEYEEVWFLNGEYICFMKDYNMGITAMADLKGNVLLSGKSSIKMEHGLIIVNRNEVLKPDCTPVCKAKTIKVFEHVIFVSDDNKLWGVVDHDGNVILDKEWEHTHTFLNELDFNDGLINLKRHGQTAYMDENGHIAFSIDGSATKFNDGYAISGSQGDYGVIDLTGKTIAEHLPHAFNLGQGYILINNAEEDAPAILNASTGERIALPGRVYGSICGGNMTFRDANSKRGVVSIKDGKVLVEPLYDLILLSPKAIWGYIPKQ